MITKLHKKAFQSHANDLLSDSPCSIVNKLGCVQVERGRTVRSKLNKQVLTCPRGEAVTLNRVRAGTRVLYGGRVGPYTEGDWAMWPFPNTAENITFPKLYWWAVITETASPTDYQHLLLQKSCIISNRNGIQ